MRSGLVRAGCARRTLAGTRVPRAAGRGSVGSKPLVRRLRSGRRPTRWPRVQRRQRAGRTDLGQPVVGRVIVLLSQRQQTQACQADTCNSPSSQLAPPQDPAGDRHDRVGVPARGAATVASSDFSRRADNR
jgi:hypothetical protein